MRRGAMLVEINALPRAEHQSSALNRNAQRRGRECGAHVRGHVVRAFARVPKQRIAVRHEALKKSFEIALHFGIGVLLNEQRSRGVLHKKREQASGDFRFLHEVTRRVGKLVEADAAR